MPSVFAIVVTFNGEKWLQHCFDSLKNSVAQFHNEKPLAVICNTTKGKDLTLQDTVDCHYLPLTDSDFQKLILQ